MKIIIFIGFAFLSLLASCDRAEQEIVLVPANYKGHIIVLFNQVNGKPINYKDGKRVYEIPPNGILKTQFSENLGWIGFVEFYRGDLDTRNRIPSFVLLKKVPDNVIVGLMGPSGTQKMDNTSNDRYRFTEFYIGTKSEIDSLLRFTEIIDVSVIAE